MAADNNSLGVFRLKGIPPAPRGVPQIEVTFEIDANGILHVSAEDKSSDARQTVTITASANLSEEEVERMMREARQCLSQDKEHRDLLEARHIAEQVIYQTKKRLVHLNGQAPEATTQKIRERIAALETALTRNDANEIRQLTAAVQEASLVLCQSTSMHEDDERLVLKKIYIGPEEEEQP